ncbi:MAG TPA: hypothetical protein VF795_06185 [Desulfuromonadaceae bacterium]
MKAYLFDTETGLYQGETFECDDKIDEKEGMTAIAPPPYGSGQVPLFDAAQRVWRIMDLSLVRRLVAEGSGA